MGNYAKPHNSTKVTIIIKKWGQENLKNTIFKEKNNVSRLRAYIYYVSLQKR